MEKKLSVVGKNVIKKDAFEKVTGKTVFSADLDMEDMLYGAVLRSTVPAAVIKNIDTSKARALEGVESVLTAKNIPGRNAVGIILKDEPILVEDKIRRIGDAIAIVAAKTEETAQEALSLIDVTYEEIEPIFTFDRAIQEDSPNIHGITNVLQTKHLRHGDVRAGFEKCDVIVEHTYKTSMLSHMFIEPEAGLATYENGMITIYSSTQNPHFDRGEVAAMMAFPQNKVRSVQMTTGGGFGGKLDISVQCHAALLAYNTKKPVKMVRKRTESAMVSSKRHPMTIHARTGATKEGKLMAMEVTMRGDTGAYASYGPAVITRAMVHCTGPYVIPNVSIDATFVYTNNPMAGAFRGFGVPQVALVHEGQIEALAKELSMDSVALRLINLQHPGAETSTGQKLGSDVGLETCISQVLSKRKELDGKEGD
ncbi:xanthine dehydrogenase family protein molybdopterin-binding subunit [Hespellia stercorisuis]|uniref:Aldehyde oxidase and xanthine dehydrogenase, a/b hammerhead domain n=1 Tax=Hespellia stercorisuis DSM 15480 TaxID=1121950 RepID=A0A1M6VE71_9FIRM|nr:molybdopterin cofactor-binding domain-containing protein [Hespellia stercorisuis]SHK79664.1 Aldehyde oxidase and xanthine dehydrogenase, a/b hammerhead domain [Hespellia stercorisuis DSM 15480]